MFRTQGFSLLCVPFERSEKGMKFYMNNEMLYQLFLNSLSKMSDAELEKSLSKAKNMLSENDYAKLLEFIRIEKEKQGKK